jgi:HEAT repeat protein
VRANAAEMLGWLQPADAVTDLTRLLLDADRGVQVQAAWALGEINTEPARLALNPAPSLAPNPAPALEATAGSKAPAPLAPSPNATAETPSASTIPAMMAALLGLALLAVVLIWKGPWSTSHLGPV